MKSRVLIGGAGLLVAASVSATIALAGDGSDTTFQSLTDPAPAMITGVAPDQAEGFAIFRRAPSGLDQPSAEARALLSGPSHTGMNIDLARGYRGPDGTGWVVPGNGSLCLVMPDPVDGFGVACEPTTKAKQVGLVGIMVDPKKQAIAKVTVLLPDGAKASATLEDGSTKQLDAQEGVVSAALEQTRSVSVTTADGGIRQYAMPGPLPVHPTPAEAAAVAARSQSSP